VHGLPDGLQGVHDAGNEKTGRSSASNGWSPCPACHEVKHAGLASKRGRLSAVVARLVEVNGWSPEDAELYLEAVFETWAARSRHQWTLDISLLKTRYGIDDGDRSGMERD
jgi:hypothetical protein